MLKDCPGAQVDYVSYRIKKKSDLQAKSVLYPRLSRDWTNREKTIGHPSPIGPAPLNSKLQKIF